MNETPSSGEILDAMKEVKDSAPGKEGVRRRYISEACFEIQLEVTSIVKRMFTSRANTWEDSLKTGQIVPLHKKGDKNNTNNYRGVCLLSMCSRIIARIVANRLRKWSEKMNLLDDNQNGFRPGRSTADSTQIMMRIQEDMEDLLKKEQH